MSFFGGRRQQQQPQQPQPETPPQQPEQYPSAYDQPAPTPVRETPIPPAQPVGFETVLGASCTLDGILTSTSNVRLDGTFTGSLEIHGNVLVGETAKITADISAKNISIAGAVRGNVMGKKVQLLRTGRVWGDITATALSTEEGAFIDGKISMVGKEEARPVTEPTRPQDARLDEPPVSAEPDFLAADVNIYGNDETDAAAEEAVMEEVEAMPGEDWPPVDEADEVDEDEDTLPDEDERPIGE